MTPISSPARRIIGTTPEVDSVIAPREGDALAVDGDR